MRNTLDIECLVQSLEKVIRLRREHDEARDEYMQRGGYSWGYYGRGLVAAMEESAEDFQKRLDAYIDARIQAALPKTY